MKLDKEMFYQFLKPFAKNKSVPIFFDMPINKENLHIRLIFNWHPQKVYGGTNPIASAQLVNTTKTVGHGKYVVPDLTFDMIEQRITTDYKLYKFLNKWVENAFKEEEK